MKTVGIVLRSLLVPIAGAVLASTLLSFMPGSLASLFLILAAAAIILCWFLIVTGLLVYSLIKTQWGSAGRWLFMLALSVPLIFLGSLSGDYIHLAALLPSYSAQIARTPERPVRFAWGDAAVFAFEGLHLRIIVYDDRPGAGPIDWHLNEQSLYVRRDRLLGSFFLELESSD